MKNALRELHIARRALALVEEWIAKAERSLAHELPQRRETPATSHGRSQREVIPPESAAEKTRKSSGSAVRGCFIEEIADD